ncbi:DUF4021 domain-containing protein [Paenibacillus sp. 102]|uniref:DUF4021 domain-containing protein n=1 Tax=Paenibacillus sp. 102 TaxID=3120823 RepID=UPI0031BB4E3D
MKKQYAKEVNVDKNKNDYNTVGLDQDEQAMNGLYGMPETNIEDRARKNNNEL